MTQLPPTSAVPLNLVQQALQNPTAFLQTIDGLLENFGADVVGSAAAQKFLGVFAEGLRDMINNSDLPEGIKQMANAIIDQHLSDVGIAPGEVSDALDNSALGDEVDEAAEEAVNEVCTACTDPAAETSGTPQSEEASAEQAEEAINEGTAAPDAAKADADAALDDLLAGTGESEEQKKVKGGAGGGSFLEALALAMGTVQANLLNRAKVESDKMVEFSGNEEKADDFTTAQAKYSAIMQMFNIYSNQVATSLKTIGEAMSAIARKQ